MLREILIPILLISISSEWKAIHAQAPPAPAGGPPPPHGPHGPPGGHPPPPPGGPPPPPHGPHGPPGGHPPPPPHMHGNMKKFCDGDTSMEPQMLKMFQCHGV